MDEEYDIEEYYIIDKIPPYDSFDFGLLKLDSYEQQYSFVDLRITKKNINRSSINGRDLIAFSTAKSVSKLFHNSILLILHNTRDEIFNLLDGQDRIQEEYIDGSKCYMVGEKQLYIVDPRSSNPYNCSLTIDLDDDYPMMRFDIIGFWMHSSLRKHTTYHLDDDVYDLIVQKIRQTIQIVRGLLMDKYDSAELISLSYK